ncbi:MAG: hypothetical protein H3C50_00730 [Kiritimatiellae bacterium]|nr:hypothetical protein [Kiritimatiellia bacterium]MCO5045300.1 hypothetical protein [Kiritimatiellia bacterium]MCO5068100.1 hypothetical protein [Kiritimatiellia bacterium]
MSASPEIVCPACGRDALLLRQPRYDGFTKVGETLSCASCGHVFESEADVQFVSRKKVEVFTTADRSKDVKVFGEGENRRLCRYCAHYVVNPFMQWCALHKKEVQATDTCSQFTPKPPEKKAIL